MSKYLQFLCIAVGLVVAPAMAQAPAVSAPPFADDAYSFYVFGPNGGRLAGREDSIQVVFARVPTDSAGKISLQVYDPASGSAMEKRSSLFSGPITTRFSVYGGKGAYTGSQTTRPTSDQAGTVLADQTFVEENRGEWVSFGPFDRSAGETVDGHTYFKIVAHAQDGRGPNMFRVGSSNEATEFFAYDLTVHFVRDRGEIMRYQVELPAGLDALVENNFDVDKGGKVYLEDMNLRASASGAWRRNPVSVHPAAGLTRLPYNVVKDIQGYANAGFYFESTDGVALKTFFADAPAPALTGNCATAQSFQVSATKCMPTDVTINEEFTYNLRVDASGTAGNVRLRDQLMEGVRYVSSEPEATKTGNTLTWAWEQLHGGDTKTITVTVVPEKEGDLKNCIQILSDPMLCLTTIAGSPKLTIAKTGPAQALINSEVEYSVTVSNVGTAVARNVVVTDKLPDALSHASQQKAIRFELGDLEAGASRQIPVRVTATQRGNHCNSATAESSNAPSVEAQACTKVVQQALTIKKTGTPLQFLGKVATYKIVVNNPGDVALTNVVVVDSAPAGTKIVAAPDAAVNGNLATWSLGTVGAGKSKTLTLKLTSRTPGNLCNNVSVSSAEGPAADSQACTEWKGHPALLLEVVDRVDPLLPGETTTYIINVTNQGTAPDTQIAVEANFPAEITPLSASGATEATVSGKKVTVVAYPVLQPGQRIEWQIEAKAVKAGDSRLKLGLTSKLLKTPVMEEESTHVY